MFDSRKELLDGIRLGESTFLELKEVRFAGGKVRGPRREDLADEIAAFANARGGVCLLGVTDEREIVGVPVDRVATVVALAGEICTDSLDPPLNAAIESLWLPAETGEELAVVKIDVPRSLFVHRSPGGYLHRVGDAKRSMSPDHLSRLFQQRSQSRLIRFDEQIVPGARLEDLSTPHWERFRTTRPRAPCGGWTTASRPRLELHSPGAIPNAISVQRLEHLQSSRNEVVTSLLAKCPVPADVPWLKTGRATLMEKRGEGVRLILENSRDLSGREPEYREIDEAELMLTIHAPPAPSGSGDSPGGEPRND